MIQSREGPVRVWGGTMGGEVLTCGLVKSEPVASSVGMRENLTLTPHKDTLERSPSA